MADLDTYHSIVRVQTRAVFMAIYSHPFLLLKLDDAPVTPAPAQDDDWESHTRISVGMGKTGSFSVLRHNAGLYRVYPLKPADDKAGAKEPEQAPPALPGTCEVPQNSKVPPEHKVLISLGRVATNDVVINDTAISKHHATFTMLANGDVTLTDKGSRNGTSVRGRRLVPDVPASVSFGDSIVMGGLALILIGAGALWEIIHGQLDSVG